MRTDHGLCAPADAFFSPKPFPLWGVCVTAAAIPLSLLWDYSWESTVGIDDVWAAPHLAGYLAVALAAVIACLLLSRREGTLGAWIVLWGAVAFVTAMLLERWWLAAYGLAAGIWHPPQLLKAVAFFAVIGGGWLVCEGRAFVAASGALLAMISVVTLATNFANRQHSAAFYQIACGSYPLVLAAVASAAPAAGLRRARRWFTRCSRAPRSGSCR